MNYLKVPFHNPEKTKCIIKIIDSKSRLNENNYLQNATAVIIKRSDPIKI